MTPIGLFLTGIRYRELVWRFVMRDLKGRYLGSYLGFLWNFIQPVILVTVYTFIFSKLMQVKAGLSAEQTGGDHFFALYIFAGMVPWIAFAESLSRCTTSMIASGNLIKKVAFPAEIIPLSHVLYALMTQLFGLAVLIIAAVVLTHHVPGARLLLLLVLIPLQAIFMLGVGYLCAALNVFIRDTQEVVSAFTILWMLVTPLFYPVNAIADKVPNAVFTLNPQYYLVQCYRWVFMPPEAAEMASTSIVTDLLCYAAFGAGALALGYWYFMTRKRQFADEI